MSRVYLWFDQYGKAAGVMLGGVLAVAGLYIGMIYLITMK